MLVVLALLLIFSPTPVNAQEAPVVAEAPGWFIPLGANIGWSYQDGCAGFILGGEVSAVYLEGTSWFGFYADSLYDFGVEAVRTSVGIEAGWFVLGIEAGYVLEFDAAGEPFHGLRLTGLLSGSLVTGYARWDRMIRDESQLARENVFEFGLLLKWPFRLP